MKMKVKKEKIVNVLPGDNLTVFKRKKSIRIGDKVRLSWNGKILEVVDCINDGVHYEYCLGDPETREAEWSYCLFNCKFKEVSKKK